MSERFVFAVIFHQIGPYHSARLNAATRGAAIVGIEWSGKEVCPWGGTVAPPSYTKVSLFPEGNVEERSVRELEDTLDAALDQYKPSVVAVNGWGDFGSMAVADCCLRHGIPMVAMSESTAGDEQRTFWREGVKRRIVSLYSAALVGGQRHVDYLVDLGISRDRIFTGYDAVDNDYFARRSKEVRSQREEVRSGYGLPENYFLASARFIEKKNLPTLIRAYAAYRERSSLACAAVAPAERRLATNNLSAVADSSPWSLVLLGDGPLRESLNSQLSALNLYNHVHLPGFKQYDELPVYYGLANAFVHASTTEQWGLVVNEAMASGLPVIVSNRCGCVPELVHEGVNGFTFDPYDEGELTARMLAMGSMSQTERASFGHVSEKIVADHGVDRFAVGLRDAAGLAVKNPRKAPLTAKLLVRALARV